MQLTAISIAGIAKFRERNAFGEIRSAQMMIELSATQK
jgi:hypothetical protein